MQFSIKERLFASVEIFMVRFARFALMYTRGVNGYDAYGKMSESDERLHRVDDYWA